MVTLQLDRLEARYGRKVINASASTPVVQGGVLTALVGPNAAGKSTLFRRIAGQLAGGGEVRITGADRGVRGETGQVGVIGQAAREGVPRG